jgi:hypothetical protein
MSRSRKLLIIGGLALAVGGMSDGLYYALFVEHQTLDQIGASLATGFARAAEKRMPEAHAALNTYAEAQFDYVRQIDVHSHWIGLAMLLIVLGVIFDRVGFDERARFSLAAALVLGAVLFPLGVILQTVNRGLYPQIMAVLGSGLIIIALGAVALGFARAGQHT